MTNHTQVCDDEVEDYEDFCYELDGTMGWTEERLTEHMLAFMTRTDAIIRNPKEFSLNQCLCYDLMPVLVQTFQHLASLSAEQVSSSSTEQPSTSYYFTTTKWKSLRISHVEDACHGEFDISELGEALDVANRASLFERIDLNISSYVDPEPPFSQDRSHMLPAVGKNKRLRSLFIEGNRSLSVGDIKSLNNLLEQTSSSLNSLYLDCCNLDHPLLCEGLASNTTLTDVYLDFRFCSNHEGESVANVLTSLALHPKLQRLKVESRVAEFDLSLAVRVLLSSTSTSTLGGEGTRTTGLKLLRLNAKQVDRLTTPLNIENILEGLTNNKSLESLALGDRLSGPCPLTNLLRTWQSHSKLKEVMLRQGITVEDIEDAQTMEEGTNIRRFGRMVTLRFSLVEGMSRETEERLLCGFLDTHPEICYHSVNARAEVPKSVQYASWRNSSGRYLMHRSDVPAGLWPQVLEKVDQRCRWNEEYSLYRQRIVYDLLHGEAFASRKQ